MQLNTPPYKVIKTSLASIVRNSHLQVRIQGTACVVSKITERALLFLKLYLIDRHRHGEHPLVTEDLVKAILKVVSTRVSTRGDKATTNLLLQERMQSFYDDHFLPLLPLNDPPLPQTNFFEVFSYVATRIVTDFETNIKQHYVEYVEAYVNAVWQKTFMLEAIRTKNRKQTPKVRDSAVRKFVTTLRQIKEDLLNVGTEVLKSPVMYHSWVLEHRKLVRPTKTVFEKELIAYDVKCKPQDYFPTMIYITQYLEGDGRKLRNFTPLRTSVIPKSFKIGTTTLLQLYYNRELGATKTTLQRNGNIKNLGDEIWDSMFKMSKINKYGHKVLCKGFKKGHGWYRFNRMIDTDGVSCSIVFIRSDLFGKRYNDNNNFVPKEEQYIDDLPAEQLRQLSSRKIVGIDPGMSDLLYCSTENMYKGEDRYGEAQFRYTQNQRRSELRIKKYQRILNQQKGEHVVDGKTVIEWETTLSAFNRKTVDYDKFRDYITAKLFVNSKIAPFYETRHHRKMKLNSYYNTRRSEQKLVTNFIKKFGQPDEVVVGIGDWSQKQHRKYKEPTKGKGFRKVLKQAGFPVLLVDEFRTSCQCFHCGTTGVESKCVKFRERLDPNTKKPYLQRHPRFVHGLLKCTTCKRLWNRDANGALNIARIVRSAVAGRERPEYLSRRSSATTAVRPSSSVSSTGQQLLYGGVV
jgi:transposase